ncbi:hypothetical protein AB1339_22390 [Streptomyces cyaneofuscatus]|uniref:hypothetical protein n=1 Tax=Streptomyces cyaneofuscatus TaxID=66883 RepID=UPI00345DC9A6
MSTRTVLHRNHDTSLANGSSSSGSPGTQQAYPPPMESAIRELLLLLAGQALSARGVPGSSLFGDGRRRDGRLPVTVAGQHREHGTQQLRGRR